MDLGVTHGAVLVGLQVAHDAGFADLGRGQREDNQNPFLPRPSHQDPGAQDCSQTQHGSVLTHLACCALSTLRPNVSV